MSHVVWCLINNTTLPVSDVVQSPSSFSSLPSCMAMLDRVPPNKAIICNNSHNKDCTVALGIAAKSGQVYITMMYQICTVYCLPSPNRDPDSWNSFPKIASRGHPMPAINWFRRYRQVAASTCRARRGLAGHRGWIKFCWLIPGMDQYLYIIIYIYTCMYMQKCLYVQKCMYVCMCKNVCMYVCLSVCMYVCI